MEYRIQSRKMRRRKWDYRVGVEQRTRGDEEGYVKRSHVGCRHKKHVKITLKHNYVIVLIVTFCISFIIFHNIFFWNMIMSRMMNILLKTI